MEEKQTFLGWWYYSWLSTQIQAPKLLAGINHHHSWHHHHQHHHHYHDHDYQGPHHLGHSHHHYQGHHHHDHQGPHHLGHLQRGHPAARSREFQGLVALTSLVWSKMMWSIILVVMIKRWLCWSLWWWQWIGHLNYDGDDDDGHESSKDRFFWPPLSVGWWWEV